MLRRNTSRFPLLVLAAAALVLLAGTGCGERILGPTTNDGSGDDGPLLQQKPRLELGGQLPVAPGHGSSSGPPYVARELVAEVAPGWTVDDINATWGTTTLDLLPGSTFALLRIPYGPGYDNVASELIATGACLSCGRNYILEAPEARQTSIAFYEGNLVASDVLDQSALARIRAVPAQVAATGQGTTVAILDTGIDASHPDLTAVTRTDGWDFVDGDADPMDAPDLVDQDVDGLADEASGHGTHVAGIVHSVAPDALLLPVRVLDTEGMGSVFGLARGIRFADEAGADVINLSLSLTGTSWIVEWSIRQARQSGALVVSSAGNDGVYTSAHFPANLPEVMGVAAVDATDRKASFSNYGPTVAISAPGDGIISTYLYQGYAVWSGTSMAAPFISGAGALALEKEPGASPARVQRMIEEAAVVLDHTGYPYDGYLGVGRVDLLPIVAPSVPGQP